uniref:biotin carboxyl carrier protein of acetyl-CoA carboxylase, chloroplastic-like n=1 Tax=Erigeron canadensis TaxID=72917 RepID=UPI001CB94658|nr:biotin carboxyl carrier protein of acetyl-CoA carboxylase, chloroplastic-like [Erigeron canadensis]
MASFTVNCPNTTTSAALLAAAAAHSNPNPKPPRSSVALFQSDFKSNRSLISSSQSSKRNQNDIMRVSAQLKDVALDKSSNSVPASEKSEESTKTAVPDAASITAFMNQVAGLVQLVDSRDIMELELKQQGCEVLIRKKEALPQPPAAPMVMMQSQPHTMYQSPPPPQQFAPASSGPAPSASAPAPPAPAPAKPKSSFPPMKCPMAGTFYRSPAPGAPSFVKVGDKVTKGQVVCIIEAMKLMNEIEADQSGTIVDILAEDGKPVSLDTPLLVIEP